MKTSTSKRLRWNVAIWLAAGLFMTSTAGMASGPILPDPKAEARHQPQVEETANGIPLVNITAPSSGGVSRNEYETFNVPDKGAILNNSYTLSKTELAGYVQGNNNMAERPAKIIVNEVTGAGPTSMDGFLEVAGNRADVVIANPNGITVNGKINASSGRIGDYLYLHGNGISTNSRAFVTDLTDSTTQFELSKSYYLHAIASDGGANSILIRPYQTMEAGTVKGVVTISATIPGRNRAIHVSSGESYFGGDVIVGKMYAPSSGTLEIAGPLKTQGVYRNTDVILSSVTRYSIKATDHTLLFYGNCTISLPSSSDGHEIWIMPNGNTISFPSGTFANSSRTNINGREWHVIKRVLGNWYLSWMSI